ncbi:MAG: VRR-NUC domain-containing protein [Saccharofermentanales bacterium]|jgi:hypothetical protein
MREITIEQKLMDAVRQRGGLCMKFVSPGLVGVPDRILLMPKGRMGFVEVKSPGKKLRKIQAMRQAQLLELGFHAYLLDNVEDIRSLLDAIQGS